ncbi:RNA-binding protein 26-like [Lingula anatina]|uniref:RNA-binding protein 26-like n=1 Tax=Lingula anatina TaxID=7574 RepID=A0A1S3JQU9_LINAN|nr:RNA-binding protein 26-like [Lingula anatina]|eukprot:XP_013412768.2 RNA-binding protein 26-like [Lingula anatina]
MLIENVDALKAWLTKTLTPICDADPEALAKYIVALVKKDKTLEELRELCNDQLEVFLQKETKSFVESLFVSLDNKSYQHVDSGVAKGHQAQQSQPPTSQHSAPGNTEKRRKSDELPDKEDRDHRRTRSRSPRRGNDSVQKKPFVCKTSSVKPYEPEPYKPTEGRPGQQPWGGGPRGPKPQQYQPQQRVPNPNLVSVPTVGSMEDKGLPGQQQHHPPQQQQQQQQLQQLQHSPNRRVVASKRGLDVPPYQEQVPPQQPNQYSNPEQQFHRGPPAKRGHFDFNRLGPRRGGGRGAYNTSSENATLEVRKIPRELNNIAKINEHFSKFGTIVNLQVCYGGDPEAALVSFASHHQANSAYRSSEPVFNNRFVKVFWHNKEQQQQQSQQGPAQQGAEAQPPSVKDRLGYHSAHKVDNTVDNSEKGFVHSTTGGSLTKTVFNPAAVKGNKSNSAEKAAQIIKSQEALKKTEEAKKVWSTYFTEKSVVVSGHTELYWVTHLTTTQRI